MTKDVASTIEDLEFMDEAGVGAIEAASRLGFASAEALRQWLKSHDANDLWISLRGRDPSSVSTATPKPPPMPATHDNIAAVIAAAQESTRAATRRKADRASDLIAGLRTIVAAERSEDEQRKTAAAEVERLTRELAKARAKLRGGKSTALTIASSVSYSEVRKWAAENGVECPSRGRVPNVVIEQFEAAS